MEYENFNEKCGNIINKGEYEKVGGYIIKKLGRIKKKNEKLLINIGKVIIRNY